MFVFFRLIVKVLLRTLIVLVSLIVVYLATALILSSIEVGEEKNAADEIEIYILSNGVHTDIVVPVKTDLYDWTEQIKYEHTLKSDTSYNFLALGWGDKGFYLETPEWSDLKASVAFKAAFALSTTAIHATFYKKMTEGDKCKKILISRAQFLRLIEYIEGSLQFNHEGKVQKIETDANYGETDAFYEAKGSYSLFRTCNSWANEALKACGQKACKWTAFDTGIFEKYE